MKNRQNIVGGIILIFLGGFFLLNQLVPNFFDTIFGENFEWPWFLLGIGFVFLILAAATKTGDLAVPGSILTGLGFIFNYQVNSQNWESWAYAWALIPGFVGIGIMLSSLINLKGRKQFGEGLRLALFSLIGFFILGSLFGAFHWAFAKYWPILLILYGGWILIRSFYTGKSIN